MGYQYDFFAGEWHIDCGCCKESLFAATRTMMSLIYKYHTKKECLGGW